MCFLLTLFWGCKNFSIEVFLQSYINLFQWSNKFELFKFKKESSIALEYIDNKNNKRNVFFSF